MTLRKREKRTGCWKFLHREHGKSVGKQIEFFHYYTRLGQLLTNRNGEVRTKNFDTPTQKTELRIYFQAAESTRSMSTFSMATSLPANDIVYETGDPNALHLSGGV